MNKTTIDGWTCKEFWPGTGYCMREAFRGKVSFTADADGLRVEEESLGYSGCSGSYGLPANVLMWLVQAVR